MDQKIGLRGEKLQFVTVPSRSKFLVHPDLDSSQKMINTTLTNFCERFTNRLSEMRDNPIPAYGQTSLYKKGNLKNIFINKVEICLGNLLHFGKMYKTIFPLQQLEQPYRSHHTIPIDRSLSFL